MQWLHDLMFGLDALKLPMAHKYQQFDVENPFAVDYSALSYLMGNYSAYFSQTFCSTCCVYLYENKFV